MSFLQQVRLFFLCLTLGNPFPVLCEPLGPGDEAGQSGSLDKALAELRELDCLKPASMGFHAMEMGSGRVIASVRPGEVRIPASTQKILTTLTALRVLGPGKSFPTILRTNGSTDTINKTLKGDLIIQGGGDPTLGADPYQIGAIEKKTLFRKWRGALKTRGIERIEGDIVGNAGCFNKHILPVKWTWEDIGNYYASAPCCLSFLNNQFRITFSTPPQAGEMTRIESTTPEIPGLRPIHNQVRSSDIPKDQAYVYSKPFSDGIRVAGTLPKGRKSFPIKAAVPDPALLLAHQFRNFLEQKGIRVNGTARSNWDPPEKVKNETRGILKKVRSPALRAISRVTNTHSINLYAEMLLLHIGKARGVDPLTPGNAGKELKALWDEKGIDTRGMKLHDGSGLSPLNRIAPEQMTRILHRIWKQTPRKAIRRALPEAGKAGTVRGFLDDRSEDQDTRVLIKSGSMSNVMGYAGFVSEASGRSLAFSLLVNDFNCSKDRMREAIEAVIKALS